MRVACQPAVLVESAFQVLRNRLKLGAQKDRSKDPAKEQQKIGSSPFWEAKCVGSNGSSVVEKP